MQVRSANARPVFETCTGARFTAIALARYATTRVNSVIVPYPIASGPIPLVVGPNNVVVDVTAQNGLDQKTYAVNVIRGTAAPPALFP